MQDKQSYEIPENKLLTFLYHTTAETVNIIYINNTFIVAIRRFEVELISGNCIPIPALTYPQAKQDLQGIIHVFYKI